MSNHVLLNNIAHKNVRVIIDRSEKYGDNVMFAATFPLEFRNIQSYYPIFFHKNNKTGSFYPIALFGFKEKENLFLTDKGWDARYIPLTIERHPFLIGFQQFQEEGVAKKQMVIHIDMDNPRVNEMEGELLFMPHGGNTSYLGRVASVLEAIHYGYEHSEGFINMLLEFDLLESFSLDIQLNDGSNNQLQGFYTINEDKLGALKGDVLEKLHNQGYLQAIYMVVASHSNIRTLIDEKNKRLQSIDK
jgi:hypothetical protein